jgi:hypothetical protein
LALAAGDLPIRNVTPKQIPDATTPQKGDLDRGWLDTLPQAFCVPRWSPAPNTKPDDWPANLTANKPMKEQISLCYRQGSSDKVYDANLDLKGTDGS